MGIEYLHIETYKGLVDKRLDDLGDVNILVGDNNTCKTTFLEAVKLSYCLNKRNGFFEIIKNKMNKVGGFNYKNFLESFYTMFYNNQNLNNKKIDIKCEVDCFVLTGIEVKNIHGSSDFIGELNFKDYCLKFEEQVPLGDITIENENLVYMLHAINYDDNYLLNSKLSESLLNDENEIKNLLQNFDENIIGIMFVQGQYSGIAELKLHHKMNGWLNLSSFGDGMKKVVILASSLLMIKSGGILLIDEIETSLHYSALKSVYSWLVKVCKERNIQLFITTHSREALATLTEIGVDDDDVDLVVYKLENYKNDIIVRRIEEYRAMSILEDGGDLR